MKELSIEEKVEAYDKVSKEVKDFFEGKRKMCSDVTKALEDLFPELKESEDEKIRKWIINEIKVKHHNLDEDNVDFVDKAIAWLEKQGEPNPYSGTSFEYNGHTWGMCARDGGVEIGCDRNLKAFLSSEKSFIYPNNSQESTASESVMEAVKEEGVNNGAEEYKPKFQIGDWIVNPGGEALHITGIKDSCYIFNDELHYWMTRYCDQKCHLWTIEDAKDGEVLTTNDGSIFIFAGCTTEGCCKHYARFEPYYGKIIVNENVNNLGNFWAWSNNVHPVTEEERDCFFRLFYGTGYKWDSENKKLIKNS